MKNTFAMKKMPRLGTIILALTFISQMPEWKVLQDRDGNTYSIDRNWKIYTDAHISPDYKPVSIEGMDYSINLAAELIRSHEPVKGIRIYQSILAMPNDNHAIYTTQIKAAQAINYLKNRHGPRFQTYYESAQPFLYRQKNSITLLTPSRRYILKIHSPFNIIRKKTRKSTDYQYFGLLLGIAPGKNNSSYEILFAIDSETFPTSILNVETYQKNWRYNILSDQFARKNIQQENNRSLNNITHSAGNKGFTGFELIAVNKNRAYFVRVITATAHFNKNKEQMQKLISEFTIVK